MSEVSDQSIVVTKVSPDSFGADESLHHAHRHDYHFFVLQEKGITVTEIDFERYVIQKPSILYQSPNQVHRALKVEQLEMYLLLIKDEDLHPEYLKLLSTISPAKPLELEAGDLPIIQQAFSLCTAIYEKTADKLYFSLLKDSCNTVVALLLSQYLKRSTPQSKPSRFETVENAFTRLLEAQFTTMKRAGDYAQQLHISVSYLNECVTNVTGFSVSHHIQQRIILEAKRELYHSDKSVKEIAAVLGYADFAYFSRLFTKIAGMSALAFRSRNRD
ncbi:AraC family transcriptional regulator [Sphingobacterium pedocola]|uniref:AraC family transcriptional regulator n=1 Tax=Sphingobacterium pedocola TaxID=2082722 RepID=A0ABR9T332_9SPHI|nr:helix-turn-helix domain-containing protein [Sphingobacterium pedocola]MBE8719695.1 AraC family transcriptional regulator [Sphingobacterium pedocola]